MSLGFHETPCRYCGVNVEYPSEAEGQMAPCPKCGKSVILILPEGLERTATSERKHFIKINEERYGSYSIEGFLSMWKAGTINGETLVALQRSSPEMLWRPLRNIETLKGEETSPSNLARERGALRRPAAAWIIIAAFILVAVGIASILVLEQPAKHHITSPVREAGNTDSEPVVLQKDPLANNKMLEAIRNGGNVETVKHLLENGAYANARNINGDTALIRAAIGIYTGAAWEGHTDLVGLLLDKGADINAKSTNGYTALIWAAFAGQTDVVKLLLDRGADINAISNDGSTALIEAAGSGHTDVVRLILNKGADINAKNYTGFTALIAAVFSPMTNIDTVKLLLDKGADINAKSNDGSTALIEAAWMGHTDVVKLLLDKGADINAKVKGVDALMVARLMGYKATVQFLQQAGAPASADAGIPFPPAVATDKPAFEVLNVSARATEQNNTWWRYGYRLTVRNNGYDDSEQFFEIQFLDADGYVIKTKAEESVIKPGTTAIITGDTLIDLPGAGRVAGLKAIWKP